MSDLPHCLSVLPGHLLHPYLSEQSAKGWACMGRHGNRSSHFLFTAGGIKKKCSFWSGIPFISNHHMPTVTLRHCCHGDTTKFTIPLHPNQTALYWAIIIKSTKQSQSSYLDLCDHFAAWLSGISGSWVVCSRRRESKCQHRFRTAETESNIRGRSLSEGSLLYGSLRTTISIYGCAAHFLLHVEVSK